MLISRHLSTDLNLIQMMMLLRGSFRRSHLKTKNLAGQSIESLSASCYVTSKIPLGATVMVKTPIEDAKNEEQAAPQPLKMQILAQYIRDMSFENILAQKGIDGDVQPEISVEVNIDAKKRSVDNQYEVIIKTAISSKTKAKGEPMFLLELEYGGIFHIENLPKDQLHPYLMIECPRMIFPFLRRIVSDVTRDGGFPPMNLEPIDFMALYRNEIQRRSKESSKEKTN